MTILEIANAFGMSVEKLANYMGYSRQALYGPKVGKNRVRMGAAIERLIDLNDKLYSIDMEVADKNFSIRENAIIAFKKMFEEAESHEF